MTSGDRPQKFRVDDARYLDLKSAFDSPNQMHYPDLGSDASSVWNFYGCCSDVISRRNQWWRVEMRLFS